MTGRDLIPSLIEASAVNGGIDIELASPLEAARLGGARNRQRRRDARHSVREQGDHRRRAVNGGVRVSDLEVDKKTQSDSKRRLEGTLNGGGAKVNISTVNGGVRIVRANGGTS